LLQQAGVPRTRRSLGQKRLAQFLLGLILIAATLAVEAIVLIALCWIVMVVVRVFPLVGRRHRHDRWDHSLALSAQEPLASARDARETPRTG